jgi:CheY-like chemotaxis protein
VVFITAHETESAKLRALARPDIQLLFKPFSDTALLGALNNMLQDR